MHETTAVVAFPIKALSTALPTFIAALALVVSLSQLLLARRSNEMAHRPYVVVLPYSYAHDGKVIAQPQILLTVAHNSPARVTRRDDSIELRNADGSRSSVLERVSIASPFIIFPTTAQQTTSVIAMDFDQASKSLTPGQTIVRAVTLEYEWVSGAPRYRYEATWRYDPHGKEWRDLSNSGN